MATVKLRDRHKPGEKRKNPQKCMKNGYESKYEIN